MTVLVIAITGPIPSRAYGETGCVAGLRLHPYPEDWVRLFPLNFRRLAASQRFGVYEIIDVEAIPSRQRDSRAESWRINQENLRRLNRLRHWHQRQHYLDSHVETSMCALYQTARQDPAARSLALIRPSRITAFDITRHDGWSAEQQSVIDAYTRQPTLTESPPPPPRPPRFLGHYRYQCEAPLCGGHRQQCLEWRFVAFQRERRHWSDMALRSALREEFGADERTDVAFYVGNQAKRRHTFSVLGRYRPGPALR